MKLENKIAIIRKEHFNAAHRLHNDSWTLEKNSDVFGKCNNANYHGHNYDLEVTVAGAIDPETGYVIDTKKLSDLIKIEIIERFDHKNLNLDVSDFKNLNPTAENIAIVIYNRLKRRIDKKFELKIKLYETDRNFVIYPYY